jgi:hypothetical protein
MRHVWGARVSGEGPTGQRMPRSSAPAASATETLLRARSFGSAAEKQARAIEAPGRCRISGALPNLGASEGARPYAAAGGRAVEPRTTSSGAK